MRLCPPAAVRTLMRVCSAEKTGTCGFFGAGGFPLYEITEGQVGSQGQKMQLVGSWVAVCSC